MKMVDVDKTANEIYAEVFNGKPWNRWEGVGNTSKAFYRKIARWHLEKLKVERQKARQEPCQGLSGVTSEGRG